MSGTFRFQKRKNAMLSRISFNACKFIKLSVSAKHEYGMDSRSEKDPWTPNSLRGNRPPVPVNVSPLFPTSKRSSLPI